MTKHTEGPLHTCANGDCSCGQILDQESSFVATCPNPDNQRRLVACWNALQGVPTELLEDAVNAGITDVTQGNLFSARIALQKQRDELLAALEKMVQAMIDYEMIVDGEATAEHRIMMAEARVAIAKAKEAS